ncbi:facilitated trehalose transporter Tret1-like [Arctopsyche grandis]|uniref:facilitated trehalose transporter Tret1-like n=1 Tax=Arctopsyche grandis TaxID=121162 RepID=UPI00406D6302
MEMEHESVECVRNRYFTALLVSLISFCCGTTIGWLSPVLLILEKESSPLGEKPSQHEISIIASSFCIGALIFTPAYSYIIDRFGSKVSALACAVPFMISWIILTGARSSEALMLARAFAGAGSTGAIVVAPKYLADISINPKDTKLPYLALIAQNAGILSAFVVGSFFEYTTVVWCLIPAPVLFFIIFIWMPDSPVYLVEKKQYKEAIKTITWLASLPSNNRFVSENLNALIRDQMQKQQNRQQNKCLIELLLSWNALKSFAICLTLFSIQNFIGVFAILCYATDMFTETGGMFAPTTMAIIIAIQQFTSACISTFLMKSTSNIKVRLMVAFFISSIGLFSFGTFSYLKKNGYDMSSYNLIPILSLGIVLVMFSTNIAGIPFRIIQQEFSPQLRKLAHTLMIMWMWTVAFVVVQLYFIVKNCFGMHIMFWVFGTVAVFGAIFVLIFIPNKEPTAVENILMHYPSDVKEGDKSTIDTLL